MSGKSGPCIRLMAIGLGLTLAGSVAEVSEGAGPAGWNYRASLPTPLQNIGTAVAGGKLFVFGGWSSTPVYDTVHAAVHAYDPAADSWSARAPMPTARHWATCSVVNGIVYVIGGETRGIATPGWSVPTAVVEAYDPATNTWTSKASMPTARWGATSQAVNGKIYVIGGSNAFADYSAVEEYDPTTNTWAVKAPMPTGRRVQESGLVGGILYVAGGAAGPTVLTTLEAYDPATNSWSTKAPMATPRQTLGMVVFGNELYALGGFTTGDGPLATVEIYDPATNAWRAGVPFQTARGTLGAGLVGATAYVLGGSTVPPNNTIASVEALPLDAVPPQIAVSGLPGALWPPNHAMARLRPVVSVQDAVDPAPTVSIQVTSSEPDNGLGDGDAPGDVVVHSPTDVELRAERSGAGPGRIYTLTWTATDAGGNFSTFTATVSVPKSQGKLK